MAQLSPIQRAWRGRVETGLRVAAPFLDVAPLAGDRVAHRDELRVSGRPGRDARRALDDGRD